MRDPSEQIGIFGHGYTYTGHPVACAAALKTLEIYKRDRLFENAAVVGAYMQTRLREFSEHPLVGEVRGTGLIAAVELMKDKRMRTSFSDGRVGAMAKQFCQEQGLLIRAVAGNSLAFCPPLIISNAQVDEMVSMFGAALEKTLDFATREKLFSR
jgi:adenosylmethionine-8-amino-7-oxononanoate aminotransferase